jgi:hypothetical protein
MKKISFVFLFVFSMAFIAISGEKQRYPRPWSCEGVEVVVVDDQELFFFQKPITGTCYSLDKLKTIVEVKDGRLHGERRDFYDNGDLAMVSTYKNGMKNGHLRVFNPNGSVKEFIFSNDELIGKNYYNSKEELPLESIE